MNIRTHQTHVLEPCLFRYPLLSELPGQGYLYNLDSLSFSEVIYTIVREVAVARTSVLDIQPDCSVLW